MFLDRRRNLLLSFIWLSCSIVLIASIYYIRDFNFVLWAFLFLINVIFCAHLSETLEFYFRSRADFKDTSKLKSKIRYAGRFALYLGFLTSASVIILGYLGHVYSEIALFGGILFVCGSVVNVLVRFLR
jgi:hypothetical protein